MRKKRPVKSSGKNSGLGGVSSGYSCFFSGFGGFWLPAENSGLELFFFRVPPDPRVRVGVEVGEQCEHISREFLFEIS